ncbi:NUDIX hydrolase [Novosphingobium sp. BW1]|uniref:NUDIX hydrolase n=1 Tax=Novosphingobium sp. BW1 TaxID=2592621 RepID=UPI0011DEFCF4|nr:NUDIX hydrolase [Novosphingobium sp. BW1]TYC92980.1 NUDIX hydrolase [Novosphingobium sp. BW1]
MTLPPDANAPEEIKWQGDYITAKTRGRWEFVGRARGIKAAVILAIDEDDHVILVDQYRVPLQRRCLELPAGLVGDETSTEGEDPVHAATRELEEETGYRAGSMENMGEFFSSPGMVSESFTLFRARNLVKVSEGGGVDDENIVVHRVPLSRIGEVIAHFRAKDYAMDVKMLALLGPALLR